MSDISELDLAAQFTNMNPSSALIGSQPFTLSCYGSGFSIVPVFIVFNNDVTNSINTVTVSDTQLTLLIPAADILTSSGSVQVYITDNTNDSNILQFTFTATGLPAGDPTFAGFQWFVANVMAVPLASMPDVGLLQIAYDEAVNLCYYGLTTVPSQSTTPSIYAFAVYNLGCALLLEFAQDNPNTDPPGTFWTNLRNSLNINSSMFGLITSAADQGTAESMYIPDAIKGMTLMDLQLAKSPWGRKYLMIAGQWGTLWGITI